jgi:hypothetical protein
MTYQLTDLEYAERALARKIRQRIKLDAEIAGLTELVEVLRRTEEYTVEPPDQRDARAV